VNRQAYDLILEPRGDAYPQLLRLAEERTQTFTMVLRAFADLRETGHEILAQLERALLDSRQATEWPGTLLLRGSATVQRYEMNEYTRAVLVSKIDGLYDWLEPDYPEDLSFYRSGAEPWLVTISHERDAYLNLSLEESKQVRKVIPQLGIARSGSDFLTS
jgi:hypothetical protein